MYHTIHNNRHGAIGGLRVLRGFFEKSFPLFNVLKIDSFEEHGELGAGERDACLVGCRQCEMKGSFFETFIHDDESVVVPVEDFDFVTAFVEEDEVGRRERIAVQRRANDAKQSVEGFSDVDGLTMKEYGNVGRRRQHAAMAARSSARETESSRTM